MFFKLDNNAIPNSFADRFDNRAFGLYQYDVDSEGNYMEENLPTWTVDVDWIDVRDENGSDHYRQYGTISLRANTTSKQRIGHIIMTWDDYSYSLTLIQDGVGNSVLEFPERALYFSSYGESVEYIIKNSTDTLDFYQYGDYTGFVSKYDTVDIGGGFWKFKYVSTERDSEGSPSGTVFTSNLIITNGEKSIVRPITLTIDGILIAYTKGNQIQSYTTATSRGTTLGLALTAAYGRIADVFVMSPSVLAGASVNLIRTEGNTKYYALSVQTKDNGDDTRVGYIEVLGYDEYGQPAHFELAILQSGVIIFPVWEDTEFIYNGDDNYIDYQLYNTDNETYFFDGRAYRLPYSDAITFNINKVMQSYLTSNIDFSKVNVWQKDNGATMNFSIVSNGDVLQDYLAYYDYTFGDFEKKGTDSILYLNEPVKTVSLYGNYVISVAVLKDSGEILNVTNSDGDIILEGEFDGVGVYHFVMSPEYFDMSGIYTVSIEGYDVGLINVADKCEKYQLIYKNLKGGYDTLYLEGNNLKKDKITNYQINKSFSNRTREYEIKHYLKDVTRSYELHTGWLTDAQAERMQNLFESTQIYINRIKDGQIIPAIITNTDFVFKTYSNSNKQMVNYDINVSESQTRGIR